jgi:hypothetical protein
MQDDYKDVPDIMPKDEINRIKTIIENNEKSLREAEEYKAKEQTKKLDKQYCVDFIKLFNETIVKKDSITIDIPKSRYGAIDCIINKTTKAGFVNEYNELTMIKMSLDSTDYDDDCYYYSPEKGREYTFRKPYNYEIFFKNLFAQGNTNDYLNKSQ